MINELVILLKNNCLIGFSYGYKIEKHLIKTYFIQFSIIYPFMLYVSKYLFILCGPVTYVKYESQKNIFLVLDGHYKMQIIDLLPCRM